MSNSRTGKLGRWLGIGLTLLIAFSAVGYIIITRGLERTARDGTLIQLVGRKTAVILHADSGYLPLSWHGMSVRSNGLLVRGKQRGSLTEMQASDIFASCSLENVWKRKWTITRLQASCLGAAFGDAAKAQLRKLLSDTPQLQPQIDTNSPLKLDIRETSIAHTDVVWGQTPDALGYLKDVQSRFYPKDHDLDCFGRGGKFRQTGWPELAVDELRMRYARPILRVHSAFFSIGSSRNISVTGDLDFGEHGEMRLHVRSTGAPAEPFITGFWHGRLEGAFNSESDLHKFFEPQAKTDATGRIEFIRALAHDVPALKQIAAITRHPQFEKPKIDTLKFDYRWSGTRLEISEFEVETKGLMRIDGKFAIENQSIEGQFNVGVAPDVAESIPGARDKVFVDARGGYVWTRLNLTGPASHPREDLKQRLVAAAEEHFASGFFLSIFKPGKQVVELLNALYN